MSKINLRDTTFIIPFVIDHSDRLENLNCILKFLSTNFDTNFVLVENEERTRFFELVNVGAKHIFDPTPQGEFHRTARINVGIRASRTPYIGLYDTDVIFDVDNIEKAVKALRDGATLSYPYSGNFKDIDRSFLVDGIIKAKESFTMDSYGGACFLSREDYIKCGGEREEYRSHCPDDITRQHIVRKLGFDVVRIPGDCYHITHYRGENSGPNKYTEENLKIWEKIKAMSKFELLNYLKEYSYL